MNEVDEYGNCLEPDHENSKLIEDCVYPFGIDPKWFIASNELNFFNSLKMKLAVIIGVIQMSYGIVLKAVNCVHYDLWIDLIFEFIP